jgi:hypothetical protein
MLWVLLTLNSGQGNINDNDAAISFPYDVNTLIDDE